MMEEKGKKNIVFEPKFGHFSKDLWDMMSYIFGIFFLNPNCIYKVYWSASLLMSLFIQKQTYLLDIFILKFSITYSQVHLHSTAVII